HTRDNATRVQVCDFVPCPRPRTLHPDRAILAVCALPVTVIPLRERTQECGTCLFCHPFHPTCNPGVSRPTPTPFPGVEPPRSRLAALARSVSARSARSTSRNPERRPERRSGGAETSRPQPHTRQRP